MDDLDLGPTSARVEGERRDHGVPIVEDLVAFVAGRVEELVGIFTACATRGAAATNAGLDSLGGIDLPIESEAVVLLGAAASAEAGVPMSFEMTRPLGERKS